MYRPFNVEVSATECDGNIDIMIRKFSKRMKKALVMEVVMEKKFFKSKSKIKHEHSMHIKKMRELESKQRHKPKKDKDE